MVVINGVKYACERCIRGHRVTTCNHTDQPLTMIKPKGRPASQCSHCREQRKTKNQHSSCKCGKKAKGLTCSCNTTSHCTCGKAKRDTTNTNNTNNPISPNTNNPTKSINSTPFNDFFSDRTDIGVLDTLPYDHAGPYDLFGMEKADYFADKLEMNMGEGMFPLFPLVAQTSFEQDSTNPLSGIEKKIKGVEGQVGQIEGEIDKGIEQLSDCSNSTKPPLISQTKNPWYETRNGNGNITSGLSMSPYSFDDFEHLETPHFHLSDHIFSSIEEDHREGSETSNSELPLSPFHQSSSQVSISKSYSQNSLHTIGQPGSQLSSPRNLSSPPDRKKKDPKPLMRSDSKDKHMVKKGKTHQPKPIRPHAASNGSSSSVVSVGSTHYQPIRPKRPESVLSVASNSSMSHHERSE